MEASTSIGVKEQYIHRVSAMDCLNKSFKNVEEFRRKIMSSTIYICLALADNTAMKWREFASFNVLSDLVFKAEEAKKSHPKQYEERLQVVNERISEYPTIRTVSDYFWGFRVRSYVIKYISEPIRIRLSIRQIFDFQGLTHN